MWSVLFVGIGFVVFAVLDNVIPDHAHAWWVLMAWLLLPTPLVLHDIWKPVRQVHRR